MKRMNLISREALMLRRKDEFVVAKPVTLPCGITVGIASGDLAVSNRYPRTREHPEICRR